MILALCVALLLQPKDDRPNVLFILTDDHRPDAMGCYGNASLRTPNFDRIAAEGARFDCFYVAAPICCASRASFLTGLYPRQHGILRNNHRDPVTPHPTLPAQMGKAGYATGFIGKAHLGGNPRRWGFGEVPLWLPAGDSPHLNPTLMVDGREQQVEGHITQIFVDSAIAWVEKHKGDRFFLWLATTAPHWPYFPDPKHPYKREDLAPPPLWPKGEPLSDKDWPGYYSTISMLDEQIGRLLARLRELGLLDKTLIVVAGDNGFMFGSHGEPKKSVWYEESARVPALARWPSRIKAGTRVSTPVVSVDLYPTLCELAGVKPPEGMEARSLWPALTGGTPARDVAYAEVYPAERKRWQLVRTARHKYVRQDDGPELLYDLEVDPFELKPVADERLLGEMRELRRKWIEATP